MNNLAGSLGDVFWDLPPSMVYDSGSELGCTIYVANPTEEEKEYALMSRLLSGETVVSEESVKVFDLAWFKVGPGDFVKLHGALQFDETDVTLVILLIERETQEVTDSVATYLVSPSAAASGWPIGWPGGAAIAPTDYSWLLPLMMLGMFGIMIAPMLAPEEDRKEAMPAAEERKLLPPGRQY
jgi:hypothetical protein